MLKIALPNKGALSEGAIALVKNAGYKIRRNGKALVCTDNTNNVEFYFLRPKDITAYVSSGVFTFGITGRDIVQDTNFDNIEECLALGFGKSKMRYIIPGQDDFPGLEMFEGKKIACSYPILLKKHLQVGVNKGAISQEDADKKFDAWKTAKDGADQSRLDGEAKAKAKADADAQAKREEIRAAADKAQKEAEEAAIKAAAEEAAAKEAEEAAEANDSEEEATEEASEEQAEG